MALLGSSPAPGDVRCWETTGSAVAAHQKRASDPTETSDVSFEWASHSWNAGQRSGLPHSDLYYVSDIARRAWILNSRKRLNLARTRAPFFRSIQKSA